MLGTPCKAILALAAALLFGGYAAAGHGAVHVHAGGGHYHGGFGSYGGVHYHYGYSHYGHGWGYYGYIGPGYSAAFSVAVAPAYYYPAPPMAVYTTPPLAVNSAPAVSNISPAPEIVAKPIEINRQAARPSAELPQPTESKSFRYDGDRPAAPPVERIPPARNLDVPPVPKVPAAPPVPKLGPSPVDMSVSVSATVVQKRYVYAAYGEDRLAKPTPRDEKSQLIRRDPAK